MKDWYACLLSEGYRPTFSRERITSYLTDTNRRQFAIKSNVETFDTKQYICIFWYHKIIYIFCNTYVF